VTPVRGTGGYLARLDARVAARARSCAWASIRTSPRCRRASRVTLRAWSGSALLVLEAAGPSVAAVKVNLAFFEAWGSPGIAALERVRARVPADLPFIADAKRGDIGSTRSASRWRSSMSWIADAVTANPYLGADAIAPLLERKERFVYLLCRTSNAGAGELQDLVVAADPTLDAPPETLALRVARRAAGGSVTPGRWASSWAPRRRARWRRSRGVAPALPFLVPGVGAQGAMRRPRWPPGPRRCRVAPPTAVAC